MPRPVRGEVRRSLLDQLSKAPARLLLFSAPSGYGKTTLAAQYARTQDRTVVWASCTAAAADPEGAGNLLAAALGRTGIATPTWHALTVEQLGVDALADALIQDINAVPHDLLLVLDHAEHLTPEAARLFMAVVEGLGDWHQIWVNTHDATPLNFARMLAAGSAAAYGTADLRFSLTEVEALVENLTLIGEQAQRVLDQQERTGGWAAVVALAAAQGSQGQEVADIVGSILNQMPADLRELVLQASVIEAWTEDLPQTLQLPAYPGWREEAQRWGLPLRHLDQGRARVDDLVRSTLDDLLQQTPARHQALHAQASAAALSQQDPYLAFHHAVKARQFGTAQDIVQAELLPRWQRYSDWVLAGQMLIQLPAAIRRPALEAFLGLALGETGEPEAARAIYEQQFAAGTQTAITSFGLALYLFRRGKQQEGLAVATSGLRLATTPYERIQLLRTQASTNMHLGHTSEALVIAEQGVQEAEIFGDPSLLISAQSVLLGVYDRNNQPLAAHRIGQQLFALAGAMGFTNKALALLPLLFSICIDLGFLDEAQRYAEYMAKHVERYPLFVHQSADLQGTLALLRRDPETARPYFQVAVDLQLQQGELAGAPLPRLWFTAAALGQSSDLDALLDQLDQQQQQLTFSIDAALVLAGRALLRDQTQQAAQILERSASELNSDYHMNWDKIGHDLLLVDLRRRLGTLRHQDIVQLTRDRDPAGLGLVLRLYEPFTTWVIQAAQRSGWADTPLQAALNAGLDAPSPTYTLRTLGGLSLRLQDGAPLQVPARALELLAYLSVYGQTSVTALADALAPKSRSARNRVQRARADLTRLLSDDLIETVPGPPALYRLSDRVMLTSDVAQVLQARSAQSALAAYRGEFLPGAQEPWAEETRALLTRHMVALLVAQAEELRRDDPVQAQIWYGRALRVEPDKLTTWEAYRDLSQELGDRSGTALAGQAFEALASGLSPILPIEVAG